ncbi:MAG: CsgG/HfaB family protein [bacterium]
MKKSILLIFSMFIISTGCKSYMQTYIKEEVPLHKIKKIAIIPFDNTSKDKNAGDKLASLFSLELRNSKRFDIIEAGEVERALKEVKVRVKGGVSTIEVSDVQKIGETLGANAVIIGTIDTFEVEKKDDPVISMNIRMLDTKDGSLIWNADYSATGSSFAYILDFGKIESLNFLCRKMVKQVLVPVIKKSKNSSKDAKIKIENVKKLSEDTELKSKDLKTKVDELEVKAKEAREKANDMESRAKQAESEALRINPEAIARQSAVLQSEIKDAEGKLTAITENLKRKSGNKIIIENKIKEIELELKGYYDKINELKNQINICQAKQRVEAIRGNHGAAEEFKKKADETRAELETVQAKHDDIKKTYDSYTGELETVNPDVKKAEDEVKFAKEKLDSLQAQSATIETYKKNLPPVIGQDQIATAKQKEAGAKTLRAAANQASIESKRLRDMADQAKKQLEKISHDADAAKKAYEEIRTKLGEESIPD